MASDRTRHDAETVALGLAKIAEIRTQLAGRNQNQTPRSGSAGGHNSHGTAASRPIVDEPTILDDEAWSPERITADMAAASARDDLQQRVQRLEAEVDQLRSALAAVLNAAATGLNTPGSAADSVTPAERHTRDVPMPDA